MPETSLVRYAVRQVAGWLDEDQRADFLLVAYQDPVRALREAVDTAELPADVSRLAQLAADQQVERNISRELRKASR